MAPAKYVADIWVGERPDIQLYVSDKGEVELSITSENGEDLVGRKLDRAVIQALLESFSEILREDLVRKLPGTSLTRVQVTRSRNVRSG